MKIARTLLMLSLSVTALQAAAVVEIRDLALHVPGAPGGSRTAFPSHTVWVGDRASVNALVYHDGALDGRVARLTTSFTTTAPTAALTEQTPQTALLTGPYTHQLTAGAATFTTAGRYRLTVRFRAQGVDVQNTFDIDVVAGTTAVVAPVSAACLRPEIRFTAPAANGWICVNETTRLAVSATLHGCDPHTLTFSRRNADGTWAVLGSRTAAPWSISTVFHQEGPVHLKAVIHDRNGASAESEIDATVGACLGKRFVELDRLLKQLPPVEKCPACGALVKRFDAARKQFATSESKLLPADVKLLEQLEADMKSQLANKK